jgi:3-dehydrotetronate 4-kinase
MTSPVLGCIADDFTGATDLANNLVRAGMRVVLNVDVPLHHERVAADALVVALKSRTVAASAAVELSLRACRWLRSQGVRQIYFKVCSTFDSTAAGNIGPVIEALMDELQCDFSVATHAFPETGRTVVHGHLFVGDVLLSESGMRHHPLTPMTDANLVRLLQAQLDPGKGHKVGLIDRWRSEADVPLLVYSTAEPDQVSAAHAQLGATRCGAVVEQAMSTLAREFVQRGVGILVVAGGETAGVCVQALDIRQMQIDPGVPWCYADGLHLALKSGNFGSPDFFNKAFAFVD